MNISSCLPSANEDYSGETRRFGKFSNNPSWPILPDFYYSLIENISRCDKKYTKETFSQVLSWGSIKSIGTPHNDHTPLHCIYPIPFLLKPVYIL